MNLLKNIKAALICLFVVFIMLVVASLADILLVFISPGSYSNLLFIVLFGVAGVFATVFAFGTGLQQVPEKNETARWGLISLLIITGVLFIFVISKVEGGEYQIAFQAFGFTLAVSTILFMKGKVE